MAEDRNLPGWPKTKLVKEVRQRLAHYGIRPKRIELWRATWMWAGAIARSYYHVHCPLPSEIASQYVLLLLADMKSSLMLRLPYRAADHVPPEVAAMLPTAQSSGLLAIADESRRKPRRSRRPTAIPSNDTQLMSKDETTGGQSE